MHLSLGHSLFSHRPECTVFTPPPPAPPPNFARPLFSISPGYYSPPKEKLKTMGMQNLGGGGGGVNTVHSGLCEKIEWPSDKCI